MAGAVADLPTLPGTRCVLRALRPADAPAIAQHANDPAVARNLHDGFPQPYTLAHAQAWCGGQHREPAFGHVWAITVDDAAVGCVGVLPGSGLLACNAEVGYWIGQACWGRGIAADALGLVSQWAWHQLPAVQRLFAPIYQRNPASQRVAAKAGYTLEALIPRSRIKGGEVIDVTQWAAYRA